MTPATLLWTACAACALLTLVAALAEHARTRRRNLDNPGWVPWSLIQILAMILTVVLAVKIGG